MRIATRPSLLRALSSLPAKLGQALCGLALLALSVASSQPLPAQSYQVTNILSDGSVPATTVDPNFINPWGVSASPNWWISAQGTGFNYVVPANGTVAFKVIVPASNGISAGIPSGSVTTAGAVGMVLPNGTKASFLFSTLDGTISGWNSKLGTANALSTIVINNAATGASYTGLALLNTASNSYLLAPNFGGRAVEVYDSNFKPAALAGSFTDPTLPASYAPYAIHVLGTQVFVHYAVRTSTAPYRTVDAPGNGIVSVFDTAGNFVARVATGGPLNSPWGVAYAPASFGIFSNALLIGNFGDGKINAYDPKTFAWQGQLMDAAGKPLAYASLWELLSGGTAVTGSTAVSGGSPSAVYFSAGLAGELHGLFASITNAAVAGSTPTVGLALGSGAATVAAGGSTQAAVSVAPVNGFSGNVTLSCSGLPVGATCSFAPAQLAVTASAPALGTLTIQTTRSNASLLAPLPRGRTGVLVALLLLPGSFGLARWRRAVRKVRRGALTFSVLLLLGGVAGMISGCGDGTDIVIPTPAGQSTVMVSAQAGSITQQTSLLLTVR